MNGDSLRAGLLSDLKAVEKRIRADLLAQYRADPALMARAMQRLRDEESAASDSAKWLETFAGRGAVLYILKTLYVRVLEDQGLLLPIRIRDGGTYADFRSLFPQLGHSAYLRRVFTDAERALPELFAPTPVEIAMPSDESATALWNVWQQTAQGGGPLYDFRGALDTRFIGDLYQDLDPDVKARYALLQTPDFIEAFILDQTMEPALTDFGLHDFRIIDPTCGSGHFLLGAFERLVQRWRAELGDSAEGRWTAAERALAAVYGADLNEYACAMSRFRLLLGIMKATGVTDLDRLRGLHINVITCDALIPWERLAIETLPGTMRSWLARYGTDEERARDEAFFGHGFHAVVGNPPYIAVKDKKKREDYRSAWPRSATGKYSLSAPMTERFLLLPVAGGRSGIIVANNFCKRSFGKGVVETVLRDVRLDAVIDTSGAYIPGHGTPTVMLFATRIQSIGAEQTTVVVAGKRGEPRQPEVPARGLVWSSIAAHHADRKYDDPWISVQRLPQASLTNHPWSLGSDAVMELKNRLDAFPRVRDLGADAGFAVIIAEDEAFIRRYARALPLRPIVFGENVRDWRVEPSYTVLSPLDEEAAVLEAKANIDLWHLRSTLYGRPTFGGKKYRERPQEKTWWQFHQIVESRAEPGTHRIVIGEVATNSQFVYDSGDAIFTRTSPVLTLRGADEERYRDVAAVLNSSTLEFWFKQVCFKKTDGGKAVKQEVWQKDYVRNGTNVIQAPIHQLKRDATQSGDERRAILAQLERATEELEHYAPSSVFATSANVRAEVSQAEQRTTALREQLVGLQEELDWHVYRAFELLPDAPMTDLAEPFAVARGHRPFEIALARRIADGDEESVWFERHDLTPTTTLPPRYTGAQRDVLERRLALIADDPTIALLEQPVFKRRWTFEPWDKLVVEAAQTWILDALEDIVRTSEESLTASDLAARIGANERAVEIGAFARAASESGLPDTVLRLLAAKSIPDNPARLFTANGLDKLIGTRVASAGEPGSPPNVEPFVSGEAVDWKRVWRLQEREDASEAVEIAVPPPFKLNDYAHPNGWRLRGKFNIVNERFIVYDELEPKRYAWGGRTVPERARLSADAFDRRGRQTESGDVSPAPEQPTTERPERCGIQFPLWDKLDELRRLDDPVYEDVRELASICGRTCPCDVLAVWRERTQKRRGTGAKPLALSAAVKPGVAGADITDLDPKVLGRLEAVIRASGDAGISAALLEPHVAGDRELLRRVLDSLRTDGRIEAMGRGRGTRHRVPTNALF